MNDAHASERFGHRTVTDAAVEAFGNSTGDRARMHFDHEFTVGGEPS